MPLLCSNTFHGSAVSSGLSPRSFRGEEATCPCVLSCPPILMPTQPRWADPCCPQTCYPSTPPRPCPPWALCLQSPSLHLPRTARSPHQALPPGSQAVSRIPASISGPAWLLWSRQRGIPRGCQEKETSSPAQLDFSPFLPRQTGLDDLEILSYPCPPSTVVTAETQRTVSKATRDRSSLLPCPPPKPFLPTLHCNPAFLDSGFRALFLDHLLDWGSWNLPEA